MTHPQVVVTIDGVPLSGAAFNALVSVTVTDREGILSDGVEIVFSDMGFGPVRRGATAVVAMSPGFGAPLLGTYVIDTVRRDVFPGKVTARGHSAYLTSALQENKTRHWDDTSVKDIVSEIAGDHGLGTKIADAVSGHVYKWIGQQDESDLSFLERVARRHGALFTIKNGTLLWLERGTGKTAGGATIPPAIILPFSMLKGRCAVTETDVERFATVKAYWQDHEAAERKEIVVDADPQGKGEHVIREAFGSEAEAQAAAKAKAREIIRGLVEVTCGMVGRPALMAGQPARFLFVGPGFDGQEFIAETVTHTFSKGGGMVTEFRGKLKAG